MPALATIARVYLHSESIRRVEGPRRPSSASIDGVEMPTSARRHVLAVAKTASIEPIDTLMGHLLARPLASAFPRHAGPFRGSFFIRPARFSAFSARSLSRPGD